MQCLALLLLGQCARLGSSAQRFDCIIEKRRGKLRHKEIIIKIIVCFLLATNFPKVRYSESYFTKLCNERSFISACIEKKKLSIKLSENESLITNVSFGSICFKTGKLSRLYRSEKNWYYFFYTQSIDVFSCIKAKW